MKQVTTVIIGAGQAGLAMSRCLAIRSVDHVILERGEVANSWRTERWDSLRLLTPNWQSRLPDYGYEGDDPDGYRDMPEVIRYLEGYSEKISAPVQNSTTVRSVRMTDGGYKIETNQDVWHCRTLVIASGACNIASTPKFADAIPSSIDTLTSKQYRSPNQLETGGVLVVGASATGVQLAKEIRQSGRNVILSVGEHVRAPRLYRGHDIKWWMDASGILDVDYREVDDIKRARRLPSMQLEGSLDRANVDLNLLARTDIEIVGRLSGLHNNTALFSGALANMCALADLKMNRLLDTIDEWAECYDGCQANGRTTTAPHRFPNTQVPESPRLDLNLDSGEIKTIIWATGCRPDYSWLQVPVINERGELRHDGGIVQALGMYVLGLPFLRRRNSSLIDGVGQDAEYLANHMHGYLRLWQNAA